MWQFKKSIMLFKNLPVLIIWKEHCLCFFLPILLFFLRYMKFLCKTFMFIQNSKCIHKGKFPHKIRVAVMIDHHLKFIRSHDTVITILCAICRPVAPRGKHPADFNQHLCSILLYKLPVFCHLLINPDSISNSCRCL